MPVTIKRTVRLTQPDGTVSVFPEDTKFETDTDVTIVCDGPRCGPRHDRDMPTTVHFNEELVKADSNALPDEYARLIRLSLTPFAPQEIAICSAGCGKDYLTYIYVEGKSPRELAAMTENDTKVDNANVEVGNQIEIPFTAEALTQIDPAHAAAENEGMVVDRH